jgi:SAM-dependent methyltransferase
VLRSRFGADYYHTAYVDYWRQNPPRKADAYLRIIRRHMTDTRRRTLLDIGCGLGPFIARAGSEFRRVYGTEVNEYAVEEAGRRAPDALVLAASANDVVMPEPIDVVTLLDVAEHVPDVEGALAAVAKQLRPDDGLALIVVPVYDGPLGWVVRLLDRDSTHVHKWGRHQWLRVIGSHLEVVDCQGAFRYLLFRRWYIHFVSRALRRVAPAIAIVARPKGWSAVALRQVPQTAVESTASV